MMLPKEKETFLEGFSDYCQANIEKGRCQATDSCAHCAINEAYNIIVRDFMEDEKHVERVDVYDD